MAITASPSSFAPKDFGTHPELIRLRQPVHQAYRILHVGFFLLPLVAGLDKYTNLLCDWTRYLAPSIPDTLGISPQALMAVVGIVEILAAMLVLFVPRVGAWVVAGWLLAIIVNLLMQGYYDIALRDLGLCLGALALARLATNADAEAEAGSTAMDRRMSFPQLR
jgi:uncharacterized membrane protein YphA (DoxX/SURF4 family)